MTDVLSDLQKLARARWTRSCTTGNLSSIIDPAVLQEFFERKAASRDEIALPGSPEMRMAVFRTYEEVLRELGYGGAIQAAQVLLNPNFPKR